MGTPQRSCPACAIISRAKREPTRAVTPPRSQRSGLPRRSSAGTAHRGRRGYRRGLGRERGSAGLRPPPAASSAVLASALVGVRRGLAADRRRLSLTPGAAGSAALPMVGGFHHEDDEGPEKAGGSAAPDQRGDAWSRRRTALPDIIRTRLTATRATPPMVSPRRAIPRGNGLGGSLLLVSLMGGAGGISNFGLPGLGGCTADARADA